MLEGNVQVTPFWFSMEHRWTALMPFCLSADDVLLNSEVPGIIRLGWVDALQINFISILY